MKYSTTFNIATAVLFLCITATGIAQPSGIGSTETNSLPTARELKHPSAQDKALIRLVRRRLARTSGLDPTNISVLAHEGIVVLTGTVTRPEQAALAFSTAARVPGVQTVVDKMSIRAPM